MLKKILYTDSGSPNSEEMIKVLMDLPAFQSAQLNILHIIPPQITKEAELEKEAQGNKLINQAIAKLKLDPNKVNKILRQGEPKDTVLKVAKEIDADLIIMGSRGLGRLEAILGNSVSQYVFQLTDRPMLLVKDDIYVKKIKRVMVAMDKSAASQYALDFAISLLKDYPGVELFLARVNPDLSKELLPLSRTEMENNPILAPAANKAKRMGISTRCLVTGGKPAQEICNLVEEYNIDLLIIGSPDRRPSIAKSLPDLDRLLGTSLSDYIRVNATCPVLLARTQG
ncbi:MAG: universal stress protein [Cyanobacteria bacterium J083]|nr:MAG: universal stress protein [Cyanobacteria bacterium J083]